MEDLVFPEQFPTNEADLDEQESVPPGWYDVEVTSLKVKKNDDIQKADRLSCKMKVVNGEHAGRAIFDDLMLPHMNEKDGTRKARLMKLTRVGLVDKSALKPGVTVSPDYGKLHRMSFTIEVAEDAYLDPKTGVTKKSNKVKFFGGWHPFGTRPETKAEQSAIEDLGGAQSAPVNDYGDI